MRAGQQKGGKVATPVRTMLSSLNYNGVAFHCEDAKHAETIRMDALMLAHRNNYDISTTKRGSRLIVYKDGWKDEPCIFDVDISREE